MIEEIFSIFPNKGKNKMLRNKKGFKRIIFSLILLSSFIFILSGCKNDNVIIPVESISVTTSNNATTISTKGGTLQFNAAILPTNADNKSVVWSIQNGNEVATISNSGLLTAITNGTVTVKATSVSDTAINGIKIITISGQDPVDMNSTLTDLKVDGKTLVGFTPTKSDYKVILGSGVTTTPTTVAIKYNASATVVITNAIDVTSNVITNRTTTVVVTSEDKSSVKTYKILFDFPISAVDLKTAGNYVILAQTGISNATTSEITVISVLAQQQQLILQAFHLQWTQLESFQLQVKLPEKFIQQIIHLQLLVI